MRNLLLILALSVWPALAAAQPEPGTAPQAEPGTSPEGEQLDAEVAASKDGVVPAERPEHLRATRLIGLPVVNPAGEALGEVSDVLFDHAGRVRGIVLASGGLLGIGAKPVGIAWSQVLHAADSDVLTVDLTAEQVAAAPQFKTKEEQAAD